MATAEKGLRKPTVREKSNRAIIEKKAYELFEERGKKHGRDLEDWFEAEKMINGKKKKK